MTCPWVPCEDCTEAGDTSLRVTPEVQPEEPLLSIALEDDEASPMIYSSGFLLKDSTREVSHFMICLSMAFAASFTRGCKKSIREETKEIPAEAVFSS